MTYIILLHLIRKSNQIIIPINFIKYFGGNCYIYITKKSVMSIFDNIQDKHTPITFKSLSDLGFRVNGINDHIFIYRVMDRRLDGYVFYRPCIYFKYKTLIWDPDTGAYTFDESNVRYYIRKNGIEEIMRDITNPSVEDLRMLISIVESNN